MVRWVQRPLPPPTLAGDGGLDDGTTAKLLLQGARPFAFAPLVIGIGQLNASFMGGVLVPTPDFLLPFTASGYGDALIQAEWPADVPSGASFWAQWWVQDPAGMMGYSATNALKGTTP